MFVIAVALGALAISSLTLIARPVVAGAQEPPVTTATTTPPASVPTTVAAPVAGANTPQPTGHELPPRSQRISDTLIWLFLVLVLVTSVLLAVFPGQVRPVPRPSRSPTTPPNRNAA